MHTTLVRLRVRRNETDKNYKTPATFATWGLVRGRRLLATRIASALCGRLGNWRRQRERDNLRCEAQCLVSAIAERFVLALTAPAERDGGPTAQVELVPILVIDFEVSFDAQTSVIPDDNLCGHAIPVI